MRVEIQSDVDLVVLSDGRKYGVQPCFYLKSDGLEGWFETPGLRDSTVDNPNGDGVMNPVVKRQKQRTVTIRGWVFPESTIQENEAVDRLNDLVCRDLLLTVYDTAGPRHCRAWIPDDNGIVFDPYGDTMEFTLVLCCGDPLKYGNPVAFRANGGRFRVENRGMVATFPRVSVSNPNGVSFISVTDGSGHEVAWEGDGSSTSVELDFRDLNPIVGNVTVDDVFTIPHGMSDVYLTADSGSTASLIVEPAWR